MLGIPDKWSYWVDGLTGHSGSVVIRHKAGHFTYRPILIHDQCPYGLGLVSLPKLGIAKL